MIIKNAKVFTKDHKFEELDIILCGDRINRLVPNTDEYLNRDGYREYGSEVIDAAGLYAIPALVDIHFHGAAGHDFCDASKEGLEKIAEFEASKGVLAICPATMTFPEETLKNIVDIANEYQKTKHKGARLVGINMEGPFISPGKIGAQNLEYIHKPDAEMFRRLQEQSGNLIKLMDIAPELEGAMECIRDLKNEVKISLAHTTCDYETAGLAFKNGASHITHLFNAMNEICHRAPGPVIAAMENHAEAELICDGIHVDPAMIRFVFSCFPEDKVILISDSMMACGLEDGQYQLGGQPVTVRGNLAVLTGGNGAIAGSVTCLYDCMKKAMEFGIPKEKAIIAASENPAKSIGISRDYGSIETGKLANILLVNESFEIKMIIQEGVII